MNVDSRKRVFTIPNIISIVRVFLVIPFAIFFLRGDYITAAVIILLSGISDMFDGMIARKLNQISDLGLILDPFADKLTLAAAIVCVSVKIPELFPVTVILISKEFLMLIGGCYLVKNHIKIPPSKWYGKMATIIFYISTFVLVYLKAFHEYENMILTAVLVSVTTISMLTALILYIRLFLSMVKTNNK